MLEENKNLKNSLKDITSVPAKYEAGSFSLVSYTKTNKLITALYMVTDIMDKEEPLRNKLRTLGINIISDIHSLSRLNLDNEARFLDEILSLLDISFALGMISEMNCNILKKEFNELKQSINESNTQNNPMWLEEFLSTPLPLQGDGRGEVLKFISPQPSPKGRERENSIGHIGVQKGSTLLKALKGFEGPKSPNSFDVLKKQRRDKIFKIIKDRPSGVSIKDIVFALRSLGEECGEKTLQRELVSMVEDGVLEKTGEKRWSRYFIKKS